MSNFNIKAYVRPVVFSLLAGRLGAKSVQSIDQDFAVAGRDILSLVLDDGSKFVNVMNHGCWCQKLDPNSNHDLLGGHTPVDDLDAICKEWFTARRCVSNHEGPAASCLDYAGGLYQVDGDKCSKKDNNECEQDCCKIDMDFADQISNYNWDSFSLNNNPTCNIVHNSNNPVKQYCYGNAPGVYLSSQVPTKDNQEEEEEEEEESSVESVTAMCEDVAMDVTFLIDGSGSINDENWDKTVDFVSSMTNLFDLGQTKTRVSLVQFSFNVKYYTRFTPWPVYLGNQIEKMRDDQYREATMTNVALNGALRNINQYGRSDIPQIVIVLTDGASSRGLNYPDADGYDTTLRMHNKGAYTFVVSVGADVSEEENKQIASDPDDVYLSALDDFDALENMQLTISNMACGLGRSGGFRSFKDDGSMLHLTAPQETEEESTSELTGISYFYDD